METDRAAGQPRLITRGPSGSAVRSNIAGMVPEGPAPDRESKRPAPEGAGRAARRGSAERLLGQERLDPVLEEEDEEGDRDDPHQRMDLADLARDDLDQRPSVMKPGADADA